MVRGNWQKRVETAEARRRETKQRKLKSEEKRIFKGWVHDLWQELDKYESSIRKRRATIHVWTDTLPSSAPPLLDLLEENSPSHGGSSKKKRVGGGRARSSSIESEGSAGGGGNNGNSRRGGNTANSKKKVHPRSKEALAADSVPNDGNSRNDESGFSDILLCRSHFLYGKCNTAGNSKKGNCKYFHYASNKYLSLADVLSKDESSSTVKAQEEKFESALKLSTDVVGNHDDGAMDMLYYSSVRIGESSEVKDTEDQASKPHCYSLSDDIVDELSRTQIPVASIVFMSVEGRLVFDRNQEGGVLPGVLEAVYGSRLQVRSRQNSIDDQDGVHKLPGAVLEHMLTFLPDNAVAMCCQVCRSWNNEIGRAFSPHLWLNLLKRHNWSPPVLTMENSLETNNDIGNSSNIETPSSLWTAKQQHEYGKQCRALFQNHYRTLRDVRALASAVPPILLTSSFSRQSAAVAPAALNEKEVAFQQFSSRKLTPSETDSCVALQQWSPNHILAGYAKDCTLRLFQATPAASSSRLGCRELVCCSIDPYKATKKRTCNLDAVGLDESVIGCLCHVSAQHLQESFPPSSSSAFILVLLTRDNFLLEENNGAVAEGLEVIDVGEAVLNFILSSDDVDHRLLPLFDYLNDSGGEVGNITTMVSRRSIAACGYGRFMIEVSISIPNEEDDDVNENTETTIQLDRKLVLFSANTQSIVWFGDSYPTPEMPPAANIPVLVSCLRRPAHTGGSQTTCSIVTTSAVSPPALLLSCEIDPTGDVQVPRVVENSDAVRYSFVSREGFRLIPSQCLLMCPSDIVSIETAYRTDDEQNDNEPSDFKTSLAFFQQHSSQEFEIKAGPGAHSVLHIMGNVKVHSIVSLRDDYIVALCSELLSHDDDTERIAGQWFTPGDQDSKTHTMVVIHVPSRTEIGRVPFAKNVDFESIGPRLSTLSSETLALAIGGLGMVMTGSDVRSLINPFTFGQHDRKDDQGTDGGKLQKQKKKSTRSKKGGSKKDGFARGMSLRG